jgi:hypothetical protein
MAPAKLALGNILTNSGDPMRQMTGVEVLRGQSLMTWIEAEQGWAGALEDMVTALSADGFQECKREMTTSRRDRHPAGGVWQGLDPRTGSVASAIWVNRSGWPHTLVFIEVDGEALTDGYDHGQTAVGAPATRRGAAPEPLDPGTHALTPDPRVRAARATPASHKGDIAEASVFCP